MRFKLTGTGTNGTQYVVFALSGDKAVPTKSNIAYIDQDAASNGTISFNLYPGSLSSGTYNVYLAAGGGNGLEKVAAFSYYQAYTLGDVNSNGVIEAVDALKVLRNVSKLDEFDSRQTLAADVNKNGVIEAVDALNILRYVSKLIDEF